MEIYLLDSDLSYQTLNPPSFVVERPPSAFRGESLKDIWKPLPVELDAEKRGRPKSDSPYLSYYGLPVFGDKAVQILKPELEQYGELLPLVSSEGTYYAYNVTNVLSNALDIQRGEFKRFSSGPIMKIIKYAFHKDELTNQNIFRLEQFPNRILVNNIFKQKVEVAGLTGFAFKHVWSDAKH